jgi:hypothetical protein
MQNLFAWHHLLIRLYMKRIYLLLLFCYCFLRVNAQDSIFIKAHR